MSDNPHQTHGNGWHTPENPDQWKEQATPTPKKGRRYTIPTMPADLSREPATAGGWRLPDRVDTTARPAPSGPRPEDMVPEPPEEAETSTDGRPEDTAQATPPEASRPEDEAQGVEPAPEPDTPTADDADLDDLDDVAGAAEAELDADEDDEAFSMNELMALQSLSEDAPAVDVEQGTAREADIDIDAADVSDASDELMAGMSPAERAALGIEEEGTTADQFDYSARLRALQGGQATDSPASQPTDAASDAEPADASGFDYNARIRELQGEPTDAAADEDELAYSDGQPPVEEADAGSFNYGDRIRELQGEDEQTESLGETSATDPEHEELVQQFRQTEQQIRQLRQQREQGLITQEQLDQQLREQMVLDNNENWWMMGVDTEIWYRYDPQQGQWLVEDPPHATRQQPARQSSVPTDTGSLDPDEVIKGSLPQVDGDQAGDYTAADDMESSQGVTPETDYVRPREVSTQDGQSTIVGESAYRDQLPGSEQTVASAAVTDADAFADDDGYVPPDDSVAAPIDPSAEAAPSYEEYEDYGETVGKARERRQRSALTTALIGAAVFVGVLLLGGAVVVGGIVLAYQNIAEQWQDEIANLDLVNSAATFQNVYIYDAMGDEIAELRSQEGGDRTYVPLEDISPYLMHAIVSAENASFFEDAGYSPLSIGAAFLQNFLNQEIQRGASTITQQVVDNLILADYVFEDAGDEKIAEIVVAAELSAATSKAEILEAYLNNIYFGNQQYGVQAAADFYFDKNASELNLAESALLAGLIPAPAQYDPVSSPQSAFNRMDEVVNRMIEVGCLRIPNQAEAFCVTQNLIDTEAAVQLAEVKIKTYLPEDVEFEYPHFTTFVQERLQQQFSQEEIFQRGFRVYTTLIPDMQATAENAIIESVDQLSLNAVQTGSAMVTDPRTGAIRAMVGSPDFYDETIDGQVNLALTYQQPGSAIKPVTYAAALGGVGSQGYYTPATILWDVPTTYPDGTLIRNFDGQYRGPVSVRSALAQSLNVPAIKAYAFVGDQAFRQTGESMGLRFQDEATFGLPTGLGATEVRLYDMMEAYGTIANNGTLQPLYAIERIEDFNGNPVEYERPQPAEGITAQVAYLLQDILSDDQARQPQFGANNTLGRGFGQDTVAAKTGTSNDARDLWTMGFTNRSVVGVWLGRVDNRETTGGLTGYSAAAPAWRRIMEDATQRFPPSAFQPVQGIVQNQYCTTTGTSTSPNVSCPGPVRAGLFIVDRPPPPAAEGFVQTAQIDSWTRDLYDQNICPNNPQSIRVANISDDTAINWLNNNQRGRSFAQQIGLDVPVQRAPTVVCGNGDIPILQAEINSPVAGGTITENMVNVQGFINAGQSFSSYDVQVAPTGSENFNIVAGPFRQLPTGNQLGEWNAQNTQNGQYTIRLAVNNTAGGFAYRTVNVNLQKPQPTATPTPTTQPTAPPISVPTQPPIEATPIPFEDGITSQGNPSGQLGVPDENVEDFNP